MVNLLLLVEGIERLTAEIREADARAKRVAETAAARFDRVFCDLARSTSIEDQNAAKAMRSWAARLASY